MLSKNKNTLTYTILKHLWYNDGITSMEAFRNYNATRLSAIVFRLREEGFDIITNKKTKNGRTFGYYTLPVHSLKNVALSDYFHNL